MKRICVDMDEVMADTLSEHLRRYNAAYDDEIAADDLSGKALWDVVSTDRQQTLLQILHAEDFFEDLPVMPDAPSVLHALSQSFEIFVATQAMTVPTSFGPKYRWLLRHFPFLPPTHFVFCGDKSILHADFLIDDMPRNLLRFSGTGILFAAPHNRGAQGFDRVGSWTEVLEYFAQR